MPNRDGTGPAGMGPGTGRGWGRCFGKVRGRGLLYGIAIPAAAGIVRDLMNPNGLIRGIARALLETFARKRTSIGMDRQEFHTKIADAEIIESELLDEGKEMK